MTPLPLAALLATTMWTGAVFGPSPSRPAPHPLHLATAQVAVDGDRVYVRLRTFKNDLERALGRRAGSASLAMAATPRLDSLYLAYVDEGLDIVADGRRLPAVLAASGEDLETAPDDTRVWWALLEYVAPAPVRELGVRATVLYDQFDDQRNVIRVLHAATDARETLYFAFPDDDLRTVRFD